MSEEPQAAPAGWYADPYDPALQRYWDGAQWTGHVAPGQQAVSAATPAALTETVPADPVAVATLADAGPAVTPTRKKPIWKRWWFIVIAAWLLLGVIASVVNNASAKHTAASPPSSASTTPSPTPTPTAASAVATPVSTLASAAVRQRAAAMLVASDAHFAAVFRQGQVALGTTRYPNATVGLAAFSDPHSAASVFSAWRTTSRAEQDTSYMDAFTQADAGFTADNEPPSIVNWRDDIGQVQADIAEWVQVAVDWQISTATDADLAAAAATVKKDLATAAADAVAVGKGQ